MGNGWARWRYPVYIGILVSTGVSSTIPLLATAVYAASMVLVHMFIVRRPVTWLSAGRRIATRITLKLLLATLTFGSLVISTTLFPFFGVAQAAVAAVSALFAALYVEGALWLMRNRLRREAETDRLDRWEWMLPAGLIGALLACAAATVGAIYGFAHVLLWSEIPGLEQLAEFLLHVKKAS
ncbi:MAG: hypothetical protein VX265_00905 [Myxococcota bacterium]|nr:hypothetical protein [Myxococcota bacterium]